MDAQPSLIAFAPLNGGGTGFITSLTIAATGTASAIVQLPGNTSNAVTAVAAEPLFYKQIQVANQASVWAYVNIGGVGCALATVAHSYPVAPGGVIIMTINGLHTYVSVILDVAGSGNVIFTRGQGM